MRTHHYPYRLNNQEPLVLAAYIVALVIPLPKLTQDLPEKAENLNCLNLDIAGVIKQLYAEPQNRQGFSFVDLESDNTYFFSLPNAKITINSDTKNHQARSPLYKNQYVFYSGKSAAKVTQTFYPTDIYDANIFPELGLFYYDDQGVARKIRLNDAVALAARINYCWIKNINILQLSTEQFNKFIVNEHHALYDFWNFFQPLESKILRKILEKINEEQEIYNALRLLATTPEGYETAPLLTNIARDFLWKVYSIKRKTPIRNDDLEHHLTKIAYFVNDLQLLCKLTSAMGLFTCLLISSYILMLVFIPHFTPALIVTAYVLNIIGLPAAIGTVDLIFKTLGINDGLNYEKEEIKKILETTQSTEQEKQAKHVRESLTKVTNKSNLMLLWDFFQPFKKTKPGAENKTELPAGDVELGNLAA